MGKTGKPLVIAGTDTAVGKTLFCGGLASVLRMSDVDVGVMKPVESGCRLVDGALVPEDALFLRKMAGVEDELCLVNPYALEHPLAPALAARREGVDIMLDVIKEAFFLLAARHEMVLIEGAGGLLSPIADCWSLSRLACELGSPLLIVSRNTLGAINQCLLTVEYARKAGINVIGVVLSQTESESGLPEELNPRAVEEWGNVPVLGVVPFLSRRGARNIAAAVKDNIDINPIIKWARSV